MTRNNCYQYIRTTHTSGEMPKKERIFSVFFLESYFPKPGVYLEYELLAALKVKEGRPTVTE